MLQLRERGRFVAAGFPQELLEPQLESLADGRDHVLSRDISRLCSYELNHWPEDQNENISSL